MFRFLLTIIFFLMAIGGPSLTVASEKTAPEQPAPQRTLSHEHKESCELTSGEPVQIICILDRSGSMQKLTGDVIGGYNSFLEQQRKESGAAEVTTVLFDDQYETIAAAVDLQKAPEMNSKIYYARGSTALLDAVGRTITETIHQLEKDNICPMKRRVLFMIMTDGLENASREYDKATVKALIEETTNDYHWNYIFMGANMDSVAEAGALGIQSNYAMDFDADSSGVQESFSRMSEAAKEARKTGTVDGNWKAGN